MLADPLKSAEFPETSKNTHSRHVHDTPEARKSGQRWYHQEKSKPIKYTYLLNGNEIDATISIYKDLTGKYQLELCFLACESLNKEETDRVIDGYKPRFIGFDAEYKEENKLFSVFLIKTLQIEHYRDFHGIADSLVEQYGLSYLEPKISLTIGHEVIPSCAEALSEENTASQGHTTISETTIIVDPVNNKRKRPSTQHATSRKKTIKQVAGQRSLSTYFKRV
jgi:hypothetical protein